MIHQVVARLGVFITALSIGLLTPVLVQKSDLLWIELPLDSISAPNTADGAMPLSIDNPVPEMQTEEDLETFSDQKNIGRSGKNKVVVRCFDRGKKRLAEIIFYSRAINGSWEKRQSFDFEKDDLIPCYPQVKDFNNDGLKDLTYVSNVAARGANEIRTLFIYDPKADELKLIKNSADYPNLAYNRRLKCLDAWLFHAATTTVFLRLEGDMLKEFASVDTGLERVASVIDSDGTRRVISRKKMKLDDIYTRYSTFDPPRP